MTPEEQYVKNVAVGVDETMNAVAGGDPAETISSRVGKAAAKGNRWGLILQAIINFIMRNPRHCQEAIEADRGGDAVVPE